MRPCLRRALADHILCAACVTLAAVKRWILSRCLADVRVHYGACMATELVAVKHFSDHAQESLRMPVSFFRWLIGLRASGGFRDISAKCTKQIMQPQSQLNPFPSFYTL